MALTAAQQATVKSDINANSDLNVHPNTSDGAFEIANLYNLGAVPDYWVWRPNISEDEIKKNVVWTEYIGQTSQGERDAFRLMTESGAINASDPNIRQGFQDIFSGPQKATTRNNLIVLAKRKATRIEKLLASGTGAGTNANPDTMTFIGSISHHDVLAARNS